MRKRQSVTSSLVALILLVLAPCSHPQANGKRKVTSQADLPQFTYPAKGSASDLLQSDDATFNAFASKVRADLDSTFRDYEIDDKAEEEKPAARLTTGLFTSAVLKAKIDTKSSSGPTFEKSFAKYYQKAIDPLPWALVQDSIRSQLANDQLVTKAYVIGEVKTDIDPSAAKSGTVDSPQAWQLIGYRSYLQFVQLRKTSADVLSRYIAGHNVKKPDILGRAGSNTYSRPEADAGSRWHLGRWGGRCVRIRRPDFHRPASHR